MNSIEKRKAFGTELRLLRRRNRKLLTIGDVSDATDISVSHLSDIERGAKNPPSDAVIVRILAFLEELDSLPRMLALAAQARESIEIPLDKVKKESLDAATDFMIALQKRVSDLSPAAFESMQKIINN